ncbi:MAG: hypothetical protein C7B43_16695 [Sulfobacillus benefaciens]|uniref:Uncharacterized protein n=1 Tax=Sulfobacillus benefaciens TaxID=453960 RepID=A0A2T2WTH4_9FIRM|nr:MAG: hypothetical protein C7B43_16695 [Sulfobacillus benefaciens]
MRINGAGESPGSRLPLCGRRGAGMICFRKGPFLMSATYAILPVSHAVYTHVVVATSFRNPVDDLRAIEDDLAAHGLHGIVLFDLLLAVGFAPHRFLAGEFTGTRFVVWSMDRVCAYDAALMAQVNAFYRTHPHCLRAGVLSRSERIRFRRAVQQPA